MSEMCAVLHEIARRDVGLFCSLCQYRDARMQGPSAAPAARAAIGGRLLARGTRRHDGAGAPKLRAGGRLARPPLQASAMLQPAPGRRA